jgi:carboxypeptidase Taq
MSSTSATVKGDIATESCSAPKSLEEYSSSYKTLLEKLRTLTHLKRVSGVLDYDRMVMMPQSDNASKQRGQQLSILASIMHEKATESEINDLIEKAMNDLKEMENSQDTSQLDTSDEHCILKLAKKSYDKKVLIPPSLEAKRAGLSSEAYSKWVKAREQNDFNMFAECLEECFDTAKEVATVLRTDEETSLYSQMLDEFETGMDASRIDEIFGEIEQALKPLIAQVMESEYKPSTAALEGTFDIIKQKKMTENVVTKMGYDLDSGRIDESVHPFTMSLGPSDVRITSRFRETEWYQGLAATIHEGGHAMYEQNLGDKDLEIDEFLSMGMHESQSLFWERHVGKCVNTFLCLCIYVRIHLIISLHRL